MKSFWQALVVALPGLIALVLLDPGDALGIYEGWVAGYLAFVLAFAGAMSGKENEKVNLAQANQTLALFQNETMEATDLYQRTVKSLGAAQAEVDALKNRITTLTMRGAETSETSPTANGALAPQSPAPSRGNTAPRTPIRGTGGRFEKKS